MKPNELRIGNYVNWINTQEPNSLYLIEEIRELNYHDCFEPIFLSAEWLDKCNFKFKELCIYNFSISHHIITNRFFFMIGDYAKQIHYLHQLQNIYFEFTGVELEIKK